MLRCAAFTHLAHSRQIGFLWGVWSFHNFLTILDEGEAKSADEERAGLDGTPQWKQVRMRLRLPLSDGVVRSPHVVTCIGI
jgi:hypothetical protein